MVIPLAEIVSRKFFARRSPAPAAYASNLTLWLGMLGAAIAARDGKLLTLATGEFLPKGRISAIAHVFAGGGRRDDRDDLHDGRRSSSCRAIGSRATSSPTACRSGSPTSRCRSASG